MHENENNSIRTGPPTTRPKPRPRPLNLASRPRWPCKLNILIRIRNHNQKLAENCRARRCVRIHFDKSVFLKICISQSSVATHLSCRGTFNNHVVAKFPQNVTVKEYWKSVNIWRRYDPRLEDYFFGPPYIADSRSIRWLRVQLSDCMLRAGCRVCFWPIYCIVHGVQTSANHEICVSFNQHCFTACRKKISVLYLNHTQLALVVLCFHHFRLQSCVIKQTTV